MTKANITQYSATASSNADINDINIAENCPASGLNNAIRELMAHLKNVDTGSQALTALSVTGATTITGALSAKGGAVFNEDSADVDFRVESNSNANMLFVDGGNDKVGIGTNSPARQFTVQNTIANAGGELGILASDSSTTGAFGTLHFGNNTDTSLASIRALADGSTTAGKLEFSTEPNGGAIATRMTIDSAGNLLVGTSNANPAENNAVGIGLLAGNSISVTDDGGAPIQLNRKSNDGSMAIFRKDGTAVGAIGSNFSKLFISGGAVGFKFRPDLTCIMPCNADGSNSDNDQNLGQASVRFSTIFATSGSINTSDKNEKQDIEELTDAEKRVAVVAKGLIRKYRWKDAVALKGDKARIHFGIMAQDLQDAFTAEGLDASRYGMFCSDTWWEKEISVDAVKADEANGIEAKDAYTYMDDKQEATTGYTEKTRLGVRYSELLAFIISAI